jgi:hypothetical protein
MTDLVRYQPQQSSLELAPQAWKLAEKIAGTDFVPTALRGRPEAVLACILAGHEAGVSPMQALSKIHIIEGRPAMSSELMRALVLQHGHELVYAEVSTTSVTAEGRRKGSERWTKVTWTMDDAKRGGLEGKQNWRKWPRAMLIARATAELCRMVFPDVLAGISHTIEELSDGDAVELVDFGPPELVASAPAAPRPNTAKAGRAVTRQQVPADELDEKTPPPAGEVPGLPGDDGIIDADVVEPSDEVAKPETPVPATPIEATAAEVPELVEPAPRPPAPPAEEEGDWPSGEWSSGDFPSDQPVQDARRYTGPQIVAIRLGDRFGIKGNTAEARAERIAAIVRILGREIESSKDLTPEEIQTVIERIDAWPEDRPLHPEVVEAPQAPAADEEPPTPAAPEIEPTAPQDAPIPADPPRARRTTPAPPPTPAPVPPEQWTGEQWREYLTERKVKVTELIREAQRLGAMQDPAVSVSMLDQLGASGLAPELVGWVEDLSLERRTK